MPRIEVIIARLARGFLFIGIGLVLAVRGADTRPVVGPGATKEEVINAYGWPKGEGRLGTKEVLNYPQGTITLADGKVERVDFSPNVTWAPPKPRPAGPSATTGKRAESWTTDFAAAAREAQERHARILAAFVGSDWSPPSRRFLEEVAPSTDFFNAFTADFVFLKLDFPTRALQTATLKKQNEELRARCGVTTYPALIVLSPRGDSVAVVDLLKEQPGETYLAQVTAAVAEVRDLLRVMPSPAKSASPAASPTAAPSAPAAAGVANKAAEPGASATPLTAAVSSAGWALAMGLGGGSALAALFVWWVWRRRVQPTDCDQDRPAIASAPVRLSDVPSLAELSSWPAERLRALVIAQFEAVGYKGRLRGDGTEADIELLRPGYTKPTVLVCCRPGGAGAVNAKLVRELFGTLVSTGVERGWIVAADGFSDDARALAQERGIELIDGDGLIERLRALDPLVLARVLGRVGA